MFSKIWLINIVLVAFIFSFGFQATGIWMQTAESFPGTVVQTQKNIPIQPRFASRKNEPETTYDVIAEKTLFSEERAEWISEDGKTETDITDIKTPTSGEPVFLYGVVMAGDYRKALVKEKADRQGRDRWVQEGDRIAGMTVKEIGKEKIFLSTEAETIEISLYDRGKPIVPPRIASSEMPTIVTLPSKDTTPPRNADKKHSIPPRDTDTNMKPSEQERPMLKDSPAETPSDKAIIKEEKVPKDAPSKITKSPFQPLPFPKESSQYIQPPKNIEGSYETIQTIFGEIRRKID